MCYFPRVFCYIWSVRTKYSPIFLGFIYCYNYTYNEKKSAFSLPECSTPIPVVRNSHPHDPEFDPPRISLTCYTGFLTTGTGNSSTCIPGHPWFDVGLSCDPGKADLFSRIHDHKLRIFNVKFWNVLKKLYFPLDDTQISIILKTPFYAIVE